MPLLLAAQAPGVSPGWKWVAALIALGTVALVFGVVAYLNRKNHGLKELVQGADGVPSTSKFQWLVWLVAILFSYVALWVLRAKEGDYSAIQDVPTNVVTVLAFSSATMAGAKGIKVSQVQAHKAPRADPANPPPGGLLKDDTGIPELAKIQMIGFTFVAIGIFLATVAHEIATSKASTLGLPDIDTTLMVLMGISQGSYLAKKVVPASLGAPQPPAANA